MPWHGPTPLKGRDGPPGTQGEPGEDAPAIPGPPGQAGAAGSTGAAGAQGAIGPPGVQGEDGEAGPFVPGPQGNAGATGATGSQGVQGVPGFWGEDGADAPVMPGPPGAVGAQGVMGPPGFQGEDYSDDRVPVVVNPPDFVGTGGSAARGLVPAPGATSHAAHPYYLGDGGTWIRPNGYVLGKAQVLTSQSTTSATPVSLTTTLSFTVTLQAQCDIVVYCSCNVICGTLDQTGRVYAENDTSGAAVADLVSLNTVNPASGGASLSGQRLYAAVPAGTYTFTQKYTITGGATGSFSERYMEVRMVA